MSIAQSRGLVGRSAAVALLAVALLAAAVAPARAQSNLSVQGYGFPTGQLSSRAYGTGGALGEMDPLSPINPAAIGQFGARIVFFQIEPEYRSVTTNAGTERTTTARYPVVFGALPLGSRWVMSLGSSTLLDRTATSVFNSTQPISATESVGMTTRYRVDGAMNDIRLAAAFTPVSWLRVGAGIHGIAGHNLISITQSFTDSTQFSAFTQQRILGFGGAAASAGVQVVSKQWNLSGSFRAGGKLDLSSEDTVLKSANVPNRFGASVAYTGIANSTISVRATRDNWSSLGDLGQPGLTPVDAWDTSVGADIGGPRIGSHMVFLRGGFRNRTLPFQASGHDVTERSITGGLGSVFANNRVLADLAVIRASRTADLPASEHAWTVSIGLSVLP